MGIAIKFFFIIVIISIDLFSCGNGFNDKLNRYFFMMKNSKKVNDIRSYTRACDSLILYPDTVVAKKAFLYYIFDFSANNETILFRYQSDLRDRLGFYEDWDVLDRFYKRYKERYSQEAVRKDSRLISEHQAYIQFLAVCNYEKIKPLYLQELSETIREGDYTYAFNSYLLPEHWEEAADTLMKYYWSVKDEDTRRRMNSAIIKIKKTKALNHYKDVCRRETPKNINLLMFDFIDYGLTEINGDTWKFFSQFIKDENIRYRYKDGYHN